MVKIRSYFRLLLIIVGLFLMGCASPPWIKHRMEVAPDKSCQTGNEAGYNIYIWSCVNYQKTVIFQKSAGLYSFPAQKQIVECGGETEFEKDLGYTSSNSLICKRKPPEWIIDSVAK